MFYVLDLDKSIFNIYTDIDSALVHLFKLSKLNTVCKLTEFNNGYIHGVYKVKNNKILYTSLNNNNIVTTNVENLPFELCMKNIEKSSTEKNLTEKNSSEINVNLPVINTEINISSNENVNENIDEEENIDELKKRIETLSKIKEDEIDELEELNKDFHDFENKVIEEKFKVDAEKNKLKHDKEKWDEFKNIFNADKRIYKIMKEQIHKKEIEEVPELFEKKYPIFKILDENNLLDIESEIYEYIKLLPDDDSVYIPKNIALKGLFNDEMSSLSLTELKDNKMNFETTIDTDDEN
jgi:hypothetical protein